MSIDSLGEVFLCRACLRETAESELYKLSDVFSPEEPELTFLIVFSEITGLQISPDKDGFPHWLCGACQDSVRACYHFRRQCQESHHRLLAREHPMRDNMDTLLVVLEEGPDVLNDRIINKEPCKNSTNDKKSDKMNVKRTTKRIPKRTNKACEQLYGEALWRPVSCSECSLTVDNVPKLIAHRVAHHTARFQCLQCGGALTTSRGLRLHQRRHEGVRPEICSTCGATFSDPRTRIIHEKRHAGLLRHVCATCGRAFSARRPLERHRATQHPHPANSRTTGNVPDCN